MPPKYITIRQGKSQKRLSLKSVQVISGVGTVNRSRKQLMKACEDVWRLVIKAKWGEGCLAKGQVRACSGYIDCSHIIPKAQGLIARFHSDNAFPLCHGHHFEVWHKNPVWAFEFTVAMLGMEKLQSLKKQCAASGAGTDLRLVELELKSILKRLPKLDDELSKQ